jgi:hypothetical protein
MTTALSLSDRIRLDRISLSLTQYTGVSAPAWAGRSWDAVLEMDGRTVRTPFHATPLAARREPTVEEIMEVVITEAMMIERASCYEEWAAELGYDTDSRTAERDYFATLHQTAQLRLMLGDLYNEYLHNTEG